MEAFLRYDVLIIVILVSVAIFVPYYLFVRRKSQQVQRRLLREDPVFVVPDPPAESKACLSTIME